MALECVNSVGAGAENGVHIHQPIFIAGAEKGVHTYKPILGAVDKNGVHTHQQKNGALAEKYVHATQPSICPVAWMDALTNQQRFGVCA